MLIQNLYRKKFLKSKINLRYISQFSDLKLNMLLYQCISNMRKKKKAVNLSDSKYGNKESCLLQKIKPTKLKLLMKKVRPMTEHFKK